MSGDYIDLYIKYNADEPSENKGYNKNLVDFIDVNLNLINRHGNYINIHLIDKNNSGELINLRDKKKLAELPAIICAGGAVKLYGTPKIKKYIENLCVSRRQVSIKTPEEEINDHQMYCMMEDKDSAAAPLHGESDLTNRANDFYNKRQKKYKENKKKLPAAPTLKPAKPNISMRNINIIDDPVKIQQSLNADDPSSKNDNDLMTKLWLNNQETKLS